MAKKETKLDKSVTFKPENGRCHRFPDIASNKPKYENVFIKKLCAKGIIVDKGACKNQTICYSLKTRLLRTSMDKKNETTRSFRR